MYLKKRRGEKRKKKKIKMMKTNKWGRMEKKTP